MDNRLVPGHITPPGEPYTAAGHVTEEPFYPLMGLQMLFVTAWKHNIPQKIREGAFFLQIKFHFVNNSVNNSANHPSPHRVSGSCGRLGTPRIWFHPR